MCSNLLGHIQGGIKVYLTRWGVFNNAPLKGSAYLIE